MFRPNPTVKVTIDNYSSATLDEWQAAFWNMYGQVDRDFPMYDMMLQLVGDSTHLAEAIRKRAYGDAFHLIPRMVSWLSTMASKVAVQNAQYRDLGPGQTLSEIVWHKYPGVCYYCGQAECVCLLLDVDRIKDTSTPEQLKEHKKWLEGVLGRARNQGERPKSIDQWVDMLDRIYGGANRSRTSAEKTFHLLEEIGEVEQELRAADRSLTGAYPARPIGWEEEVADVFSWIVAVFCHIRRSIARTNGYAEAYARATGLGLEGNLLNRRPVISELLWFEFGDPEVGLTCHRCHKTRCDMTLCPNESHESCRGIDNSDLPPGAFRIPPRR